MRKVKTIIAKEWAEVFKNRLVLFTVAFLPLIFLAIPLVTVITMDRLEGMEAVNNPGGLDFLGQRCAGLSESECVQVYMLDLFTLLFMILPVAIPVTIAAYSIVGEKTTRSLEPLLATPITTLELLAGKALAAITPAIVVTWLTYLLYLFAMRFMVDEVVFGRLLDPMWFTAIFIVGPLLTVLSVSFAMIVSSRASDPRVAEQLSSLVILPLILLIVGQSVGFILLNQALVLLIALIVALLDVVLIYLSVKLFQREVILTQWR